MKKEDERGNDGKSPVSSGKGVCQECGFYTDCPRMKGINHCYNIRKGSEKKGAKEKPSAPDTIR